MKFVLRKASDLDKESFIDINDLRDLEKLEKRYGHDLIISFKELYYPNWEQGDYETVEKMPTITVYDDYME